MEPGQLRCKEVSVGLHIAPAAASVPVFIERWASRYGHVRRGEAALVAMACAHQRLGWIHPFMDGNGRVMRLHTHTLLSSLGYTNGLWSPLRGFARGQERYYALLADADRARRGDLDGRGNLSELALIAWALLGGPVWAWIGVVPLATGLFNFCPLYKLVGINTCRR